MGEAELAESPRPVLAIWWLTTLLGGWFATSESRTPLVPTVLLRFPALLQSLTFAGLPVVLCCGGEILLELLHRAAGLADEPSEIPCHAGELAWTENYQQ